MQQLMFQFLTLILKLLQISIKKNEKIKKKPLWSTNINKIYAVRAITNPKSIIGLRLPHLNFEESQIAPIIGWISPHNGAINQDNWIIQEETLRPTMFITITKYFY